MTYAKPTGTMYATAGLGMGPTGISPPFRRYGFRSFDGLGYSVSITTTEMPTEQLQQLLLKKGFSVGPSGADGLYGRNTRAAFRRALGDREPSVQVSSDKRTLTISNPHLNHVLNLPDNSAPTPTRVAPTRAPEQPSIEVVSDPSEAGAPTWLPWVVAAGGVAAIGGYFLYQGRRQRRVVVRNRRRRRRTSRRR